MARVSPKERADWQARVDRLNRSGLSVGEFAEREGVHPGTLALWRSRLKAKDDAGAAPLPSTTALSFVALDPVERATAKPVPFEVGLAGGRSIRVWPGFDAVELVRLARVLEEVGP